MTSSIKVRKESGALWLLYTLPALVVYIAFMAFPVVNSMRLSFFTGSGYSLDNFVGFNNYVRLFTDPNISVRFFTAFRNTWVFFAIQMLVQNTLGVLFALILSGKGFKGKGFFRTIIFIPVTLSVLVTGYIWKLILNPEWGAVNIILTKIGLGSLALPWLGDTRTALAAISLVSSWQWVGLPTMMFLAGLERIPDELFEAAQIDGAGGWLTFAKVKLPLLMPVVGIVSVLTFVGNFNAFDVVFAMEGANGPPDYATDLMGTFFYRTGIAGQHPIGIPDMGLGAAVATVTFVVLFAGILLANRLTGRGEAEAPRRAGEGA
ncbi:MAG TPA: sugar ABC transporter permease [Rectinemataceae bacterium]|nr:sugar ABC transporter permease [Rectinemataceae bacterium]